MHDPNLVSYALVDVALFEFDSKPTAVLELCVGRMDFMLYGLTMMMIIPTLKTKQ
jgi:hypothetical protein